MENHAFRVGSDDARTPANSPEVSQMESSTTITETDSDTKNITSATREKWGRDIEFMLSCIAYSVGFGNIWKFPYTALKYGGGAFLLPYLIVLFVVGRPIYYLEMVLGQFSSRGVVKLYDLAPAMRGIGVAQTIAMFVVMTYYAPVLAITFRYFVASFSSTLPWSECDPSWANCINSSFTGKQNSSNVSSLVKSSAELYFNMDITHKAPSLDNGLGMPDWRLTLCLLFAWIVVATILVRGAKSTGKASYFLAIFPYVIMVVLLIQTLLLDGAMDGIMYFFKPQWDQLLSVKVWYEAVTQCFFSLSVCYGGIVAYSSFNNFSNNVHRDAVIISWLDTFTSIIAGCIVFGVIGNLAYVSGETDIQKLASSGAGLTFITYPDAIAKFQFLPQLFAVLFFLMLFVVGVGSNLGVTTSIITAIRDQRPDLKHWWVVAATVTVGFFLGLLYLTPGGFEFLDVVDYYGAKYVSLTFAVLELATVAWVYGVDRICRDIQFMLGMSTSLYWRLCWGVIAPIATLLILIFSFTEFELQKVPVGYNVLGIFIYALAVLQLPGWYIYAVRRRRRKQTESLRKAARNALKPLDVWGPEDDELRSRYQAEEEEFERSKTAPLGLAQRIRRRVFNMT
ncbi:sodium-dependent nutrient amino acid transporter 1-like [Anopheles cruzii]|uniref:sodium-dependent nutrient amino acid transporter 1-like n=1 Tax=Anopheles cruzii TaxID=68878 RepID=UPI0022EC32FD|nr:sodium-dependent nutrient amino acid transporter 1-like [Anopheles cruzii]